MNLTQRVHNFWQFFNRIKTELEDALKYNKTEIIQEYQALLNERLISISGCGLELEYADAFFELTFESQHYKNAQYICELLKKDADASLIENWIINAYRQPLSEKAYHTVLDIKGKTYAGSDFMIYYDIDKVNKCIPIKVYCEGLKDLDDNRKMEVVQFMLQLFIGELEVEARIGEIQFLDEPLDSENFCLLPNFFEDICDIIIDNDWIEYHNPTQIYLAYKIDEASIKDVVRKDMKLIVTTHPQLQEELLNAEDEICRDLKDKGGEFGYLYYEFSQQDENIALVRQELEKELDDLLYDLSIARTIGGAIGIHYAYIDLIIFNKNAFLIALKKIQERLPFDIYYKSFM